LDKINAMGGNCFHIVSSNNIYFDADRYNQYLSTTGKDVYKVLIAGVGKDGRTCGIYPYRRKSDFAQLYYSQKRKAVAIRSGSTNPNMISITPEMIGSMNKNMLYIVGVEKKNVLNNILYENKKEWRFPSIVYQYHPNTLIFTDIFII
jgi:6-phosphogluconolactonase/glucosamine-6-phosphate isomerase/deaminase